MCWGCDTSYIVSVHIQCQASIYTLSLCRGHSWRVRLAKQETLTPPGHLVSPLVCRGPWMSTVVLYCWYHSDSASVLLYFTYGTKGFNFNDWKETTCIVTLIIRKVECCTVCCFYFKILHFIFKHNKRMRLHISDIIYDSTSVFNLCKHRDCRSH